MEKETCYSAQIKDVVIVDHEGNQIKLPETVEILLKDANLKVEAHIMQTSGLAKYTGHCTVTVKENIR